MRRRYDGGSDPGGGLPLQEGDTELLSAAPQFGIAAPRAAV